MSDSNTPFLTDDADLAVRHFAPLVADRSPAELTPWLGGAAIIRHNVETSLNNLKPHWDTVRKGLADFDIAQVLELSPLALALEVVAGRVFEPASDGEIQRRQAVLRPLRQQLLLQLQVFALRGLVPADVVDQIRAGRGQRDEAKDLVDAAGVFRDHAAALGGKHPFSEQEINDAAVGGSWLLTQLAPRGARPVASGPSDDERLRNRLWNELDHRYDELFKAGAVIWGRRVEDYIIPLRSRVQATTKATPPDTVPPSPPVVTSAVPQAALPA